MRIIEKIKKYDVILMIILILMISVGDIFYQGIITGDEYLLLNHTLKMYNGKLIYKDINVLITPLLFYIGVVVLKLLGTNYLAYRIFNVIITLLLYLSIYTLFKKINLSKKYSTLYTIILFTILKNIICYGANYNVLAMVFSIIGIILVIEKYINRKKYKYYNLIQGIITFLILFTKQNIGVYYFIANVLVEIFVNKKNFYKNILKQSIIFLTLFILYFAYLYSNGSLYNFIDYTILGMKEFVTENKFIYSNHFILYAIILVYIILVILKFKTEKKNIEIIKILMIYSIIYLLIAFPILEIFHSLIAGIPLMITFIYCFHISFINEFKIKDSILNKIIIVTVLLLVTRTAYFIWSWQVTMIEDKENVFYGAVFVDEEQEAIKKVTQYIEDSEERVIILCPEAGIYNMTLGIDNGILDLPTQGNVGVNGEQKIINILSNLKETKILMTVDKIYWQEYDEVREYVYENFEKIDEIRGKFVEYNVYCVK